MNGVRHHDYHPSTLTYPATVLGAREGFMVWLWCGLFVRLVRAESQKTTTIEPKRPRFLLQTFQAAHLEWFQLSILRSFFARPPIVSIGLSLLIRDIPKIVRRGAARLASTGRLEIRS